jgi:hypothetical protein
MNTTDGAGFEPAVPCGTHAFQACPIDRSGTHPKKQGGDSEAETPEFQLKLAEGGGSAFCVQRLGLAAAASLRLNGFVCPRKMDFVDDMDFVDAIK